MAEQGIAALREELACSRSREALLAATLESTEDGILALQFEGGSFFYNEAFARMWSLPAGGPSGRQEMNALQAAQAKDPDALMARIRTYDAMSQDFSVIELKDGRIFERRARPQLVDGRSVGRVINYRDVTQRLRVERKLLFNQVVVEGSGPMLWADCASRQVLYANRAACDLLGYAAGELLARRVDAFDAGVTPDSVARMDAQLRGTGRPVSFRTRYRRKDGGERNVDAIASLAEDGERTIYIINFKDITEEKRQARERGRQQALVNALVDSITDLISYRDPEGVLLGCNPAFCRAIGKEAGDVVGRTIEQVFPPAHAPTIRARDRQVLDTRQGITVEESFGTPEGEPVHYETVRELLRDSHGAALGVLSISRNVTARKRAEEEVRRAKEIAEQATRLKSDFLANMSHEIRTPMNAIIGLSHLALKTGLSGRQRDYIEKVQASGQHLLGIVNDILDFSKVEAGKLDIEREEFDLQSVLDHAAGLVADKAAAKGLELVFDVAADVPRRLLGDSLRIGQILINYLNNAVKYTQRGRVSVSLRVAGREDGGVLLHCAVTDTGIGLTGPQQARLFQSFSQADSSTTRTHGGTGLGLAISKKLAQLMGGDVGVHSRHGQGSTFWFTVRVDAAAGAARPGDAAVPPSPQQLAALRGARVLVVEDNDINQRVAEEILRDAGVAVEIAGNGQVGVAMARVRAYDLVLMDMQMPVMDGLTATQEIRKLPGLQRLPIVATTANAMQRDRERCLAAGMDDFVAKPIDPDELARVLLRWIAPRRPGTAEADACAPPPAGAPAGAAAGDEDGLPRVPGLDTALGLRRAMGRKPLYLNLLRRYADSQRDCAAQVRAALDAGDWATAERLAHTAKGLAGSIGAEALAGEAAALEHALRERRPPEEVARRLEQFGRGLAALLDGLLAAAQGKTTSVC